MNITGHTRFTPLLAHPCTHVRTPAVFNAACQRRGIDMVMVPLDVQPANLADTVTSLRKVANLAGFIVTIPHKTAIASLCDRLVGAARMLGVCNAVRKEKDGTLSGGMFDGEGFVAGLRHCGHEPAGRDVLLIGAGGAASGVAHALLGAGVARLTLLNRSSEKANDLADRLLAEYPNAQVRLHDGQITNFDLVINGTSLGMKPEDPLPLRIEHLPHPTLLAEVVMQPDLTPFLAKGHASGHQIHKGIHMVEQQIDLLVDFVNP